MKFLVDRCAGRRLADWLRTAGHDVIAAAEQGPDPGDAALLRQAVVEDRVLVTIDSDFSTLVYRFGASHRGIVRLPDVPATERIRLMDDLLARHALVLPGAIVTVKGNRIRWSGPQPPH